MSGNQSTEMKCGSSLAEDAWAYSAPSLATSKAPQGNLTSHDEAAIMLRQLRSQIAADIIIDPSTTTDAAYPTFLSPLQPPSTAPHTGTSVPLIYCDHTASHRPSSSIENYLRSTSYPCHANTHTNITYTGSQSTAFVAEARQIVAESTGARVTGKASLDVVLFTGNGVTGAVATLIDALNLRGSFIDDNGGGGGLDTRNRPIIFVGPHEHHSNLLPWREAGCEVVNVPASNGMVDLNTLESMLSSPKYGCNASRLRMGAFSAVSNVTGLIANVDEISTLLHKYDCLSFFDYASGAPYLKMNMNPPGMAYKDALYFSPHKCFGGTSTPGVLVVKKRLVSQTNPPRVCGGGTVFYVTEGSHRFLSNRVERYEGGTPDGIGIQRVGLALLGGRKIANEYERIVQSVSQDDDAKTKKLPNTLLEYECLTYDRVVAELKNHAPNLIMLGSNDTQEPKVNNPSCVGRHIPVFSFLIRCGKRFLHYNYVCAILNDVFGIQSRGGCQCAGPYSQYLLGLTKTETHEGYSIEVPNAANRKIEQALLRSDRPCELLRPGYTRLSLPFKGLRDEEVDYVVKALIWVAKNAWVFLPQYTCDHRTGEWRHWSRRGKPLGKDRRWLSHYDILSPKPANNTSSPIDDATSSQARLDLAMKNANAFLDAAKSNSRFLSEVEKMSLADGMLGSGKDSESGGVVDALEELRWYVYQQECVDALRDGLDEVPLTHDKAALLGGLFRQEDDNDEVVVDMELETDTLTSEPKPSPSIPTLLSFQEGDHTGEAPYEEIKAGFEDGELSNECVIFHHASDEWIPIEEFIQQHEENISSTNGRKRDLSEMKVSDQVIKSLEYPSSEDIHSMKVDTVTNQCIAPACTLTPAADKREKKKPSRDNSQWGQHAASHITTSTSAIQDSYMHDEKKTESPETTMTGSAKTTNQIKKSKKNKLTKPPPKMMRFITQAMIQWDMIQEGDRLLLGLSGGKDSLSLLHCLLEFQRKLPIKFEIEVCTIDPMTPSFDPSPLIPYVESLGLKYHYIRDDIVERAASSGKDGKTVSSLCAFCARMKRGNLYTCARKNNCNKLVLAQHLDDCAESFLMSVMHNGFIRTMKANYKINAGDISVIRPLVYCRESLMTEFAKSANLPIINENCPACFEEPKERARIKKLLSREETLYPNLYDHIRRALIPIMHDDSTAIMRCYLEETIAKSVKVPSKGKKKTDKGGAANASDTVKNVSPLDISMDAPPSNASSNNLESVPEEMLIAELARRRAAKFQLSGAMKRLSGDDDDPTGQVCTLNGGNGSIPCRELME